METDSLYLALAEDNLEGCILTEIKALWLHDRRKDFRDNFIADAKEKISSYVYAALSKKA